MNQKFYYPRLDVAFKKIFGKPKCKNIMIAFLNDVLKNPPGEKILDLEYPNTNIGCEQGYDKSFIIDVFCKDESGKQYIVEMQNKPLEGFDSRALFYWAGVYRQQLLEGGKYKGLLPVISVSIYRYIAFKDRLNCRLVHQVLDSETKRVSHPDLKLITIELPKFTKTLEQLTTDEDRWYYFLKNANDDRSVEEIIAVGTPIIKEACDQLLEFNWTVDERTLYESQSKVTMDNLGHWDYAKNEGARENNLKNAKNMLNIGIDKYIIAQVTGLTLDEIDELDI